MRNKGNKVSSVSIVQPANNKLSLVSFGNYNMGNE
jgi:hypothetical protein